MRSRFAFLRKRTGGLKRSFMFLGTALFCGAAVLSAQEPNPLWKEPESAKKESLIPALVMPQEQQIQLVNAGDQGSSSVKAPVYKAPASDLSSLPPLSSAPNSAKSEFPAAPPVALPVQNGATGNAPKADAAPGSKGNADLLRSRDHNPVPLPKSDPSPEKRAADLNDRLLKSDRGSKADPYPAAQSPYNSEFAKGTYVDECPDPKSLPLIKDISYKVEPKPGQFPESCPLPDEIYVRKMPTPITFTWKASNLCYKPLYFEDVQLERYGNTFCPLLQPVLSRARFWLTIPILPYLMGVNPPNECIYDLGYYRPGNCAPYMLNPIPVSLRGGLMEAGVIVGGCYLFP